MVRKKQGGGFPAIRYTLKKAAEVGGLTNLYKALSPKNTCKACALGMGGQKGGMVDEKGSRFEVCKKSMQAQVSDMQPPIPHRLFEKTSLKNLRNLTPLECEKLGRLAFPLYFKKGMTHLEPKSWAWALDHAVQKMTHLDPLKSAFYFSGRSSNEAGFLLQLFARTFGTNHVNNCSYYCHQASGVGLSQSIGSGTATIQLEDLDHCDTVFLFGANPASNHPRFIRHLLEVRRRGGRVVIINPVKEPGLVHFRVPSDPRSLIYDHKISTHYFQPNIGGDQALLFGIAKSLFESEKKNPGLISYPFIENHTENFENFSRLIKSLTWTELIQQSGLSKNKIEHLAEIYGESQSTIFSWAMGVTHHQNGSDTVSTLASLALMRGMIGRVGAGLLPLRGHSNVQGMGSMGVTPELKKQVIENLETRMGIHIPGVPGMDTMACMEAALKGDLDFLFHLGGNLFLSNPDTEKMKKAYENLKMSVYLSTTLNPGHFWGVGEESLIFPVLARDEEKQKTSQESMFNYVRLSDGGSNRILGPRSEVGVIHHLACRLIPKNIFDWSKFNSHSLIREAISEIIPGYHPLKEIEKSEFQIPGRVLHSAKFNRVGGRAQFIGTPYLKSKPLKTGEFRLMTVRSEGQFNTVVYEKEDLYRGQENRDIILLNPKDIKNYGLHENQRVTISSEVGRMNDIRVKPFKIRRGNALMYYPEANLLVGLGVDPKSKTPSFKNIRIRIETDPGQISSKKRSKK